MMSKPRRQGRLTEYQNGHYFLYVTEWDAEEDGAGRQHVEIEIYYARAHSIWNTTDPWKLEDAKRIFDSDPAAFKTVPADTGELPTIGGD